MTDIKSLLHDICAAPVAAAQAAHDARKPEIERLRGALTQMLVEYEGMDDTELCRRFGMSKTLRIRKARAALAKAGR